jgi:maleylacetoacetate isomerase
MQLYSFFNSSTSYRVRIALALKGLSYEYLPINIRKLEHRAAGYVEKNASASVPFLVDGEFSLGQSMAIIDYLDATYPTPRIIPQDKTARARVLEISNVMACDMHPINNLRILKYLQDVIKVTDAQKKAWYDHWIEEGFTSVEQLLEAQGSTQYCVGDAPTLADCCLVPQVANSLRMGCKLDHFTHVMSVYQHCSKLPAFQAAEPTRQPDYTA